MPLVALSVTYAYDFHAEESPINYNVVFGVALLRCAAPQILKCAWEEVVVFPSLERATNPLFVGIRLMDVISMLSHEDIVHNLKASGFCLEDDNSVAHMWAQKTSIKQNHETPRHTPVPDKCSCQVETPSQIDISDPSLAKKALREHVSNAMKREIKQLVIDMFPRDSEGVILSESADTPSMRRPLWVMDELFRSLNTNWDKTEASKGFKYAVGYVRRERARQLRVMACNSDDASEEREELRGEALMWKSGPYGKAWAANMRDRPRPQQLLAADAATHGDDQVYKRCALCPIYYKTIFYKFN